MPSGNDFAFLSLPSGYVFAFCPQESLFSLQKIHVTHNVLSRYNSGFPVQRIVPAIGSVIQLFVQLIDQLTHFAPSLSAGERRLWACDLPNWL